MMVTLMVNFPFLSIDGIFLHFESLNVLTTNNKIEFLQTIINNIYSKI